MIKSQIAKKINLDQCMLCESKKPPKLVSVSYYPRLIIVEYRCKGCKETFALEYEFKEVL
jgi:transposase-like protein